MTCISRGRKQVVDPLHDLQNRLDQMNTALDAFIAQRKQRSAMLASTFSGLINQLDERKYVELRKALRDLYDFYANNAQGD